MNPKPILLYSVGLAILSGGLAAVPPKAGDAASPKEGEDLEARRRAAVMWAVGRQILDQFPDPSWKPPVMNAFSRARPIPDSRYTLALTPHAPEGKNLGAVDGWYCIPFEIRGQPAYAKEPGPVVMFGYCQVFGDGSYQRFRKHESGTTVFLYHASASQYVAGNEHPLVKAQLEAGGIRFQK